MQTPEFQPSVNKAAGANRGLGFEARASGLTPQGCGFPKNVLCASAVAACLATPNPVACILSLAPHCADCL
jgi:hypothetical protein